MEIAQPANLVALQWVIIVTLVSAVGYLFRELNKRNDKISEIQHDLLSKTLTALGETNEIVGGLADALDAYREQLAIKQEIESLRSELKNASKKKD